MKPKEQTPLIGAHVSIIDGIELAPRRARWIGCNCAQIFCGSPRVWSKNQIPNEKLSLYKEKALENGIVATVIHAQYLVNLASDNEELVTKALTSLSVDMHAAAGIGAVGVVVHVGSHQGRGWDAVKEVTVARIGAVLEASPDNAIFLIENSAGQNGKIGSDFREIAWMLEQLKTPARVGWCLDSCHAFAAGYPSIRMDGEKFLFDTIDELALWDTLKVIHINDSRDPYLSRKDRHANLLDGMIKEEQLRAFLAHPKISSLPLILEVPGIDGTGPDKENVERLMRLLSN